MQNQGTLKDRYQVYRECADDGHGNDITTGDTPETREPLKTFNEWLNS